MKILVTGANGYIGQGIVKALLDKKADVIATDLSLNNTDKRAQLVEANIFEINNPYDYFGQPEVLLHLAWQDGFKHDSLSHIADLPKHYLFIKEMAESGIKQIAVMGSMHEIGFFEGSIDENTPTNPQSLYGISKNALRQSIQLLQRNHDFIFQWLRGFYIVGNTEYGCSVFSKITEAEQSHQKEFPFTMGTNQYDFISYEEFCMQVAAAVCQKEVTGIINCCSGSPMRLGERVEHFLSDMNYSIKLKYGAFSDRPYDSKAVWGNNNKITAILEAEEKNK